MNELELPGTEERARLLAADANRRHPGWLPAEGVVTGAEVEVCLRLRACDVFVDAERLLAFGARPSDTYSVSFGISLEEDAIRILSSRLTTPSRPLEPDSVMTYLVRTSAAAARGLSFPGWDAGAWKTLAFLELCPSTPPGAAREILSKTGDLCKALDVATKRGFETPSPRLFPTNPLDILMQSILDFLHSAHRHCILCRDPLDIYATVPMVCSKELCRMSYCELGVGLCLERWVAANPQVADLVLSLFVSAVKSGPIELAFPVEVLPDRNHSRLVELVSRIPSVTSLCFADLKKHQQIDAPPLIKLVHWVFARNPVYLRPVPPMDVPCQLPFTITHAFKLVCAPLEIEKRFRELKAEFGSFFAFHGSPLGNWYTILAMGLVNFSGTKYMLHGQAHGPGCYFSKDLRLAAGYSTRQGAQPWEQSSTFTTDKSSVVSLCEIIRDSSRFRDVGSFFIVTAGELVIPRFLLVQQD